MASDIVVVGVNEPPVTDTITETVNGAITETLTDTMAAIEIIRRKRK